MTSGHKWPVLRIALLFGGLVMSSPALACTNIAPVPLPDSYADQAVGAVLRWAARPDTPTYRLQLRLSRPEGPTLRTLDIQTTATELRLSPLPDAALISLQALIGVGCDHRNIDDLLATRPVFTLRQSLSCQMGTLLPRWQGNRLGWDSLQGAQSYRVRLVTVPSPAAGVTGDKGNLPPSLEDLVQPRDAQVAHIELPQLIVESDELRGAVLLVQPVCQGKPGSTVAARLPLPLPPHSAPAR